MKTLTLPFAPWEPDKAALGGEMSVRAFGVVPAATGYRPFRGPAPSGGALPERVLGAFTFADTAGSAMTLAGTADALYARGGTQSSLWEAKSAGTLAAGNNGWNFALYGPSVFAVNGVDAPQYAAISPGALATFAAVDGAPAGRCIAPVGDFLMLGDLPGNRNRVRWSAMDNPLSWPEPGSNGAQYAQSDYNDFPEGGNVQAIASGMAAYDGLIFCETAIYRAQYEGPPYIFRFTDVDKSRGTVAPRSVIQANNLVYFLARDGLYATDGATVRDIGAERVNLWLRENADDGRREKTLAAYDPISGVIAWAFASRTCPADRMDRLLLFHPELNRFSLVHQDTEWLYTDAGRGLTLEDLDAYGPLDGLPFSLDAKSLINGVPLLAAFGTDHRARTFSGLPVHAGIETAERGGARMMIHGARAAVDGAQAAISIVTRDFQQNGSAERPCAPASVRDGICRCHVSTRYARAAVAIPAGVNWTHALGVEIFFEEEGGM